MRRYLDRLWAFNLVVAAISTTACTLTLRDAASGAAGVLLGLLLWPLYTRRGRAGAYTVAAITTTVLSTIWFLFVLMVRFPYVPGAIAAAGYVLALAALAAERRTGRHLRLSEVRGRAEGYVWPIPTQSD